MVTVTAEAVRGRIVLRGAAAILTGLKGDGARGQGDIAIQGGRIQAIGAIAPEPGDREIDARGTVIYPGLVNTHHHLSQSVLKGVPRAIDAALPEWLVRVPYTFWHHIGEEAFRAAIELGMAELMLSGVTSIADHHYIFDDRMGYDPAEILFEVAERLGIRFVLARGGATRNSRKAADGEHRVPAETARQIVERSAAAAARFHDPSPDSRRRVAIAPTNLVWSVEPQDMAEIAAGARALGLRLHSHLSEGRADPEHTLKTYGKRAAVLAHEHGFTGPDVWLAHLIHLDENERALLAETGTAMAHCPQSNSRLGAGIASAPAFAAAGGIVALGVDGAASNESCDMLCEMHAAWRLHRALGGPEAVTLEEVVHWACAGGAAALGFPDAGRIAPGALADIAVFDLTEPRYAGLHDVAAGPVICGGGGRVRHLFTGGEAVVLDGRIAGCDLPALLTRVSDAVAGLQRAASGR